MVRSAPALRAGHSAAADASRARSAQDLLTEFVRDGRQQAFEEIVRRYAGMVFNTCLQVLRDTHDAEDATQAVFLTLAVQAKTENGVKYLAPWLQKVAQRLALDVKRAKTRRKNREEKHGEMRRQAQGGLNGGPSRRMANGNGCNGHANGNGHGGLGLFQSDDHTRQMDLDELKLILRDELDKLPAKYRLPLILHYFGGLRPEEMSRELGCKPSTLGVRLHRGRKLLADSLANRGLVVNGALLTVLLAAAVQTTIAESLIHSTCRAAGAVAHGGQAASAAASSGISAQVLSLHQIAASGIAWSRLKTAVAAGLLTIGAVAGATELAKVGTTFRDWSLRLNVDFNFRTLLDPLFRSLSHPMQSRLIETPAGAMPANVDLVGGLDLPSPQTIPQYLTLDTGATSHDVASPYPTNATAPRGDTTFTASRASANQNVIVATAPNTAAFSLPAAPFATQSRPTNVAAIGSPEPSPAPLAGGGFTGAPATAAGMKELAAQLAAGRGVFTDNVVMGAAPGANDTLTINRPVTVAASTGWTVGDRGNAIVSHSAGAVRTPTLVLGRGAGGTGFYDLSGVGSVTAPLLAIGDNGSGKFQQSGQSSVRSDAIALGMNPSGVGVYEIKGGTLTGRSLYVGVNGTGTVEQFGGQVSVAAANPSVNDDGQSFTMSVAAPAPAASTNPSPTASADATKPPLTSAALDQLTDSGINIAKGSGSKGTFNQHGGTVSADNETVAFDGNGTFKQTGGTNTIQSLILAAGKNASALYDLSSGALQIQRVHGGSPKDDAARFVVGAKSDATLKLGDAKHTGQITEVGPGRSTELVVRANSAARGVVRGWGDVDVQGGLTNNGLVIADGYGSPRTLDLSGVSSVTNSIDNPVNGTNGWYARRGGELVLPTMIVPGGTHTLTWGESSADQTPDLINSVRLTFHEVTGHGGDFGLSLLARDRSDVPDAPGGREILGLWRADVDTINASSIDLLVRYDHALADELQGGSAGIELWSYSHHRWHEASTDAFAWSPGDHTIAGTIADAPIFAVMGAPASPPTNMFAAVNGPSSSSQGIGTIVPEPSTLGVLSLGTATLLRRRRRLARPAAVAV